MRLFRRLKQIAFGNQLQPVRNIVMYRALPFAVRVTAVHASGRLGGGALGPVLTIDLLPVGGADLNRSLRRLLARQFDKL